MNHLIVDREGAIRLTFFVAILSFMVIWEVLSPRRSLNNARKPRWTANLGLVSLGTLSLRFLLPIQAVGVALYAEKSGLGLLNQISLHPWVAAVIGVGLLDFAIYLQHSLFHRIPLFWRLHGVHHTDLDFDTTTGVRFHPVEILLSMGIKMGVVLLFGISAVAVIIFEVLLNATSLFNHGNVKLSGRLDRVVRLFVVTPEMHRVHHSVVIKEHNSNFGFNFPWWDRLLMTYCPQPAAGHEGMAIGLSSIRDPQSLLLTRLLGLPFGKNPLY